MDKFYEEIIHKSLVNKTTTNLQTFVKNCKGCFIVDCVKFLKESNLNNNKKTNILLETTKNKHIYKRSIYKYVKYNTIPQMLDSDWRFTYKTQNYLFNKISKYCDQNNRFLFVGTPSLIYNKNAFLKKRDVTFIEKNITSIRFQNKVVSDIMTYSTEKKFDAIICDPPWYKDAYLNFIFKFGKLSNINAFLFVIFPPFGVRESIERERSDIINFAKKVGYELIEEDVETINYISSPFEINSILDNKITNFPIDWRYGNLLIFKYVRNETINFIFSNKNEEIRWREYTINNIRIKLLPSQTCSTKKIFEKIYDSDILPTVSMRNDKLKLVNFWTSGNRVFKCNNTKLVSEILNLRSKKSYRFCLKVYKDKKEIIDFIENIISLEYKEYGKYWDKTSK